MYYAFLLFLIINWDVWIEYIARQLLMYNRYQLIT